MGVMELVRDIKATKEKLAALCLEGRGGSIEFTDTLVALMALQESLINLLMARRGAKVIPLSKVS